MKIAVLTLALLLLSCSSPKPQASSKQYPLTGKVVAISLTDHTATIDGSAIPNYMEAMKMDYPIASASELSSLKVGESIAATVNVNNDGSYNLTNIHEVRK